MYEYVTNKDIVFFLFDLLRKGVSIKILSLNVLTHYEIHIRV